MVIMYDDVMSKVSTNTLIGILLKEVGLFLFKELIPSEITFSLTVDRRKLSCSISLSFIFNILGWSLNLTIILEIGSESILGEHGVSVYPLICKSCTAEEKYVFIISATSMSLDTMSFFSTKEIFLLRMCFSEKRFDSFPEFPVINNYICINIVVKSSLFLSEKPDTKISMPFVFIPIGNARIFKVSIPYA